MKKYGSERTDKLIFQALIFLGELSPMEVAKATGLSHNVIGYRLKFLASQGKLKRRVLPKHGHYIKFSIPPEREDETYLYVYGKMPLTLQAVRDAIVQAWAKFGLKEIQPQNAEQVQFNAEKLMRLVNLQPIIEAFSTECPWVDNLPPDKASVYYKEWLLGHFCPDCGTATPIEPMRLDKETGEYSCLNCGGTHYDSELEAPLVIRNLLSGQSELK